MPPPAAKDKRRRFGFGIIHATRRGTVSGREVGRMGTKIRVFIASTMEDLENERSEVVTRVRQLNFEPVNAEGWLPTGSRPWDRIEKEMESCHLFVLILGNRYGWIPET